MYLDITCLKILFIIVLPDIIDQKLPHRLMLVLMNNDNSLSFIKITRTIQARNAECEVAAKPSPSQIFGLDQRRKKDSILFNLC